jgi:ABC-type amino acid transport substrate-binding protein
VATPHPGVSAIPAKAPQIHTQPNKAIHMRSQLLTLFVLVFVLAAAQVSAAEPLREGITPNYEPLTEEALAWAVRKDDGAPLRDIEKAFDEIKSSGTLGAVLNRWIPLQVEVQ